jgi:hypothetical protein
MNLDRFGQKNAQLKQLLTKSAHWQRLGTCLKRELPANMHDHFTVACVRDGQLVVIAHNSMIASRLRMVLPALLPSLQQIDHNIEAVRIRVQPAEYQAKVVKQANLTTKARQELARSADALSHHPELAAALRRLSNKGGR